MNEVTQHTSWLDTIKAFKHPRVVTMLFLGISAGLPTLLIFSTLGFWLLEAGVERATVTYFSWAALGYSFKFVWAPLIDLLPLPFLTRILGRRRAWMLLSQLMIILAIGFMAMIDPVSNSLVLMGVAAVLLGFSSATQDIVIDAYRIESAELDLQALMASTYIAGYRIAWLVVGAGSLVLAEYLGSTKGHYLYSAWQSTYLVMASLMLIGVATTLVISEPTSKSLDKKSYTQRDYLRILFLFTLSAFGFIACFYYSSATVAEVKTAFSSSLGNANLAGVIVEFSRLLIALTVAGLIAKTAIVFRVVEQKVVEETYMEPVRDFFVRYGLSLAWLLLALIGLYRISDIVLGVISNVFYYDMGFSKNEVAKVVKTFGFAMTLTGGFLGGVLTLRYGVMRILFLGAILSALTNLLFMLLAQAGHDMTMLYIVIAADNLSAGLASAAFIAFLSSLTNVSFTAMQYAIFSSLMLLLPKILGGYSGTMVETMGYQQFFLLTALMGIPVLLLIVWANKRFDIDQKD